MYPSKHRVGISTVAWGALAVVIISVGGFAAYYGSYAAVKSSQNSSTLTTSSSGVSYTACNFTVDSSCSLSPTSSSSTTDTTANQPLIIQNLSFNETSVGSGTYEYNTIIKNIGAATISGNLQLGFLSLTGQILANANCILTLPLESGQSIQCSGNVSVDVSNGQTLTLEVITQKGSTVDYSFKVEFPAYSARSLASATLYGGTENPAIGQPVSGAYFAFAISSQGDLNTTITGLTLTGSSILSTIANWETSSGVSYTASGNNAVAANQVTSFTFHPYGTAQTITTGQTFNYVIQFSNGQSVSGSLIAQ
jgi:hypothetical protein